MMNASDVHERLARGTNAPIRDGLSSSFPINCPRHHSVRLDTLNVKELDIIWANTSPDTPWRLRSLHERHTLVWG